MALWNEREYGDIGQGTGNDEKQKNGQPEGQCNAI